MTCEDISSPRQADQLPGIEWIAPAFGAESQVAVLGIPLTTSTHEWVHWRSIYFFDPEGNEVEFVCYDSSVV